MDLKRRALRLALLPILMIPGIAFLSPRYGQQHRHKQQSFHFAKNDDEIVKTDANSVEASSKNPEDILSKDRRSNLFQFMLRDLQIEGVPLLSVDADQVHTLQAAIWTTMAELLSAWKQHKGKHKEKACLIFEEIPVDALRSFVDDFRILQTQERLMEQLPELARFHLSVVGKGVGPAILMKIGATNVKGGPDDETIENIENDVSEDFFTTEPVETDEAKLTAAMKMFVDRVIAGMKVCPHFNFDLHPQQSPTEYRVCGFNDVCHVLSAFWNCICQLQTTKADDLSAIVLLMPAVTDMKTTIGSDNGLYVTGPEQRHARFAAVAELLSRSLCLYRGDNVFELLHFHPTYTRDNIHPADRPAHGHLPQTSWLRQILKHYLASQDDNDTDEGKISDADLQRFNYQRRAPVTAVCIKRVASLEELATRQNLDGMTTDLDVGDGVTISASTVASYARNILRMAKTDEATLQAELEEELAVAAESTS